MNLDMAGMGTSMGASLGGDCIVCNMTDTELCTIMPLVPVYLVVS